MAFNQNNNFWDFVRSFDNNNNGAGVDHTNQPPPAFSFGGPPPHHGPHGHPHHPAPPPGAFPFGGFSHGNSQHTPPPPGPFPFGGSFEGRGRHGRRGGRCGRRASRHGEGPEAHFGPGAHNGAFDLNALLASLSSHPFAQAFRTYAEQFAPQQESGETRHGDEDEENNFVPPVDIFSTESHFILHVALPGAKKEDVGINWDVEKGALNIAGVIYRQGDEEFLKSLTQSERKVGVFERTVKLPPGSNDEKEEIDGDAITAKLEDGVLVITIPKMEKEWTDVKKVDIE